MTLLTLLRIAFLVGLGVHLLSPNNVARIVAGVASLVLGVLVLLGQF